MRIVLASSSPRRRTLLASIGLGFEVITPDVDESRWPDEDPAMFVERPDGTFALRRGFRLNPGTRVLMVEDVVTTGLSSKQAIAAIESAGGSVQE